MKEPLVIGLTYEIQSAATPEKSAKACASGELDVFATPMMIALMEQAADESVRPYLEDGCATVGTKVEISHLSATPVGMKVSAKARLIEQDGRKLVFEVEAFDEAGKIGEGCHERCIIQKEPFMSRANDKQRR